MNPKNEFHRNELTMIFRFVSITIYIFHSEGDDGIHKILQWPTRERIDVYILNEITARYIFHLLMCLWAGAYTGLSRNSHFTSK